MLDVAIFVSDEGSTAPAFVAIPHTAAKIAVERANQSHLVVKHASDAVS